MRLLLACASALAVLASGPVAAKVVEVSDRGFVVRHLAEVPADATESWDVLLKPSQWWDSEHTWSGSAANLSIDPRAGGCFCEILPNRESSRAAPRGSVEHMRVVFVEHARALRMVGALGPLQADAAEGTMTVLLKPAADGKGTRIQLEYVVGGYVRPSYEALAPAVDGVLGNQIRHLVGKLGGKIAAASPVQEADSGSRGEESREAGSDVIGR